MKKMIFALVAALTVASCSTLRVAMDQTQSDGTRNLITSDQYLFRSGGGSIDIALGERYKGNDTVMAFLITYDARSGHGVFNKGNKLMFRLNDGSEISLTNIYDKEYDVQEETHVTDNFRTDYGWAYSYSPWTDDVYVTPYEVTRVVPQVRHYKTTNSYGLYLVSKTQLKALMTKGIKKLRVETENDELDWTDTEGVSKLITDMYNCLQSSVATGITRTTF